LVVDAATVCVVDGAADSLSVAVLAGGSVVVGRVGGKAVCVVTMARVVEPCDILLVGAKGVVENPAGTQRH
jgi:hypothetical protein